MSMRKYIINFVVAFIAFGALFVGVHAVFADAADAFMAVGRPVDAPEQIWGMIGHVLQTIGFVWLFMKIVTTQCWKAGAMFGFAYGLVLGGTDLSYYGGMPIPAETSLVMVPASIIISMIVGAILGVMNKQKD